MSPPARAPGKAPSPPRVRIAYEVEVGDAIELRELPFVVGVLGDFTGMPAEPLAHLRDRRFVEITPDNFDDVLSSMRPCLQFSVDNELDSGDERLRLQLQFTRLDDFAPDEVPRQVEVLRPLLDQRRQLKALQAAVAADSSLADSMLKLMRASEPNEAEAARVLDGYRLSDESRSEVAAALAVLRGVAVWRTDLATSIAACDAELRHRLSAQTRAILHHPDFQRLEATWRGLAYLVNHTETGELLKIKVFNISKKELLRDFTRAPEFDQTTLFRKVYEEEYGIFGGAPYSALVGAYEFGKHPEDIELLGRLASVAASAHAPFLSAASADLFNLESFTKLTAPRDLAKIFDTVEYKSWHAFRASEDARYVALVAPRMLLRLPQSYQENSTLIDERVDGTEHHRYLWGNAAFGLAARLTSAFARFGWTAGIRGPEGGGVVTDLPLHRYTTEDGDEDIRCPTEVAITDRRESEMASLGFVPLVHCKGTNFACFFSTPSCQKAKLYDNDEASVNARFLTQLPYVFVASRFAHYMKAMMRDKLGIFESKEECAKFLNRWLARFVTTDNDPPVATRATYPLRAGRVDVFEVLGKPGQYRAVVWLQPNFQLPTLGSPLRTVVTLPSPGY